MAKETHSKPPKEQEGEKTPPGWPLEFLEFSTELMKPGGVRDRGFGARGQRIATPKILRVKVALAGIRPPVWRRLELPGEMSLAKLHVVLQIAFSWIDDHLHQFERGRERWGVPSSADFEAVSDERRVRLGVLLRRAGDHLDYEYDFGDSWRHRITVEAVVAPEPGVAYPRCTAGRRAAPPEDCGGPFAYPGLLATLADPEHEGHDELLEWLGDPFDPEAFDLAAVERRLARPAKAR